MITTSTDLGVFGRLVLESIGASETPEAPQSRIINYNEPQEPVEDNIKTVEPVKNEQAELQAIFNDIAALEALADSLRENTTNVVVAESMLVNISHRHELAMNPHVSILVTESLVSMQTPVNTNEEIVMQMQYVTEGLFDKVKEFLSTAVDKIKAGFNKIIDFLKPAIMKIEDRIKRIKSGEIKFRDGDVAFKTASQLSLGGKFKPEEVIKSFNGVVKSLINIDDGKMTDDLLKILEKGEVSNINDLWESLSYPIPKEFKEVGRPKDGSRRASYYYDVSDGASLKLVGVAGKQQYMLPYANEFDFIEYVPKDKSHDKPVPALTKDKALSLLTMAMETIETVDKFMDRGLNHVPEITQTVSSRIEAFAKRLTNQSKPVKESIFTDEDLGKFRPIDEKETKHLTFGGKVIFTLGMIASMAVVILLATILGQTVGLILGVIAAGLTGSSIITMIVSFVGMMVTSAAFGFMGGALTNYVARLTIPLLMVIAGKDQKDVSKYYDEYYKAFKSADDKVKKFLPNPDDIEGARKKLASKDIANIVNTDAQKLTSSIVTQIRNHNLGITYTLANIMTEQYVSLVDYVDASSQ